MKKIILYLIALLSPFMIVNAKAVDNVNFKVTNVYINASVDILGSMHVTEAVVINGSLNGFDRVINYQNSSLKDWEEGNIDFANSSIYNARAVSLSKVKSFKVTSNKIDWLLLDSAEKNYEQKDTANSGDSGVYTLTKNTDGIDVKVYNPNETGYVVYLFDYYIDQPVVLHGDVAELYWQFIPTDFDDIDKVNIQVTIPGKSTSETFRFWAHGSLNGEIAGISDESTSDGEPVYTGIVARVDDVTEGSGVDVRMTFDKYLMNGAANILNNSGVDNGLEEIIKVEEERANKANSNRQMVKTIYYGLVGLDIIYLIIMVALWIYVYRQKDREYKVNFNAKYYREFTGDYNVEVIDYLMNKEISTKAMSASIMNLIYKKNLSIEEITDKKGKKDYLLKLINRDNLNKTENDLVDLIINDAGNGESVSLEAFENYSKKSATCEKFMSSYNRWKSSCTSDAENQNFFENHTTTKAIIILYVVLGFILLFFNINFNIQIYILLIIMVVSMVAFLIYSVTFKKWTLKGRDHYLKWSAFKNFLQDFGSFKEKELPEIKLWERYLVYATVFGIAKTVQKSMQIKLTEVDSYNRNYLPPYMFYRDVYIYDSINRSVNNAYSGSQSAINAKNASSSMSSGSGFGGGFSSGGGFGGGGGGGHGF